MQFSLQGNGSGLGLRVQGIRFTVLEVSVYLGFEVQEGCRNHCAASEN